MNGYFVRITRSYADASGVIRAWSTRATKMVVYEHVGEKTEKTHIHILILNPSVESKQLRNIAANYVNMKGNENASFKTIDDEWETSLPYMTKGCLEPKYLLGYNAEDANVWKSKWVQPSKHIKISPAEQLYNRVFDDNAKIDLEYYKKNADITQTDLEWNWLKQYTRQYLFHMNRMIWTQKQFCDQKMLIYSYILRNGISIPQSEKDWKKYF